MRTMTKKQSEEFNAMLQAVWLITWRYNDCGLVRKLASGSSQPLELVMTDGKTVPESTFLIRDNWLKDYLTKLLALIDSDGYYKYNHYIRVFRAYVRHFLHICEKQNRNIWGFYQEAVNGVKIAYVLRYYSKD